MGCVFLVGVMFVLVVCVCGVFICVLCVFLFGGMLRVWWFDSFWWFAFVCAVFCLFWWDVFVCGVFGELCLACVFFVLFVVLIGGMFRLAVSFLLISGVSLFGGCICMVWCLLLLSKGLFCFVFLICLAGCFVRLSCVVCVGCCFVVYCFVMFHWLYCCLAVCLMCFVLSCFAVGNLVGLGCYSFFFGWVGVW